MNYLADTHALLWSAYAPERLSAKADAVMADPSHTGFFSFANVWEVAIKLGLRKLTLPQTLPDFVTSLRVRDLQMITPGVADAVRLIELPHHHRDPFDRMLIAQAMQHGLTVITADPAFGNYEVRILW